LSGFLDQLPMLAAMAAAGSLHCAGMCGGLAVLAGGVGRPGRFLLYLAGKAAAYIFLGALAGALGETVLASAPVGWGARALAASAGALLLLTALDFLGILRPDTRRLAGISHAVARLAVSGRTGTLLMGAANGLLPCPMVYAFAAMAAMAASPLAGAAVMLVLAAATAVPLALCSVVAGRFSRFRTLAALLMLAMAVLTIYRGLSPAALPHHHLQ
jgi:uncharacterized protein